MGRAALQKHLQREIVHGPDAQLSQILDISETDVLCVHDVIIEEGVGIGVGGIEHASESVDEIMSRNGPAVVPTRAGTQMERPFPGVVGDVVTGGGGRDGLPQLVSDEQGLEGQQRGLAVVQVDLDVEAARFGTHHVENLLVRRRRVGWQGDTDRIEVLTMDKTRRRQSSRG